VPSNILLIIQL